MTDRYHPNNPEYADECETCGADFWPLDGETQCAECRAHLSDPYWFDFGEYSPEDDLNVTAAPVG